MMVRFGSMRSSAARGMARTVPFVLFLAFLAVTSACTPLEKGGNALSRGDQAYAKGDLEEALAEYRLALRQGSTDPETYARVAHTYLDLKRIDEAREHYREAVARDSTWADQAAADFVHVAREENRSGDRFGMASAVQTAALFRPGITLEDLALSLARHYLDIGEYGRALPYYQMTLSGTDPDSVPELLFEIGIASDEIGDCQSAVVYYEEYRERLPRWRRGEVDWRLGNCSFRLARDRRAEGQDEEALEHLETLLRLGEPRNLLAMAYFEKGEILGERGECEAAIEAFSEVAVVDPSGRGPLVDRAMERIDQIRFGGAFERLLRRGRPAEEPVPCFPPEARVVAPDTIGAGSAGLQAIASRRETSGGE